MENPEIWHSLKESGNRQVKEGRFTEAIIEYTKAIRIDPNQPVLYSNRAIAELRLKMYKEAREDAENAIEKSNSSSSAESRIKYYRLLSEALIGLDLLDDAFSACLKGLQLDSRDEVLLLRKRNINSLMIKKQTDENPREDPKALIPRVEKDITFALNFMEQYQRLKPANEYVLDLDWNKYNQNMRLTSRLKEAHEWMNGINGKRVDKRKALRIFEETANRGSAEGLYNVGLCFSKGYGSDVVDYSKAIEFYRKAASQKPFFRFNI
jgi:tetratricopeptide (TPR) repeat protein